MEDSIARHKSKTMTIISPYSFHGIARKKGITIDEIIDVTFQNEKGIVMSRSRRTEIIIKRQIVMYLCRHAVHKTYTEIASYFDTDHSNVMNNCKRVQDYIDTEDEFKASIDELIDKVKVKMLLG